MTQKDYYGPRFAEQQQVNNEDPVTDADESKDNDDADSGNGG